MAAAAGGAAVHLALQACGGKLGSGVPDAQADARADAPHDADVSATPVITDWQPYTPVMTTAVTLAVVANQTTQGMWRRIGDTIEVRVRTTLTAAPTGSSCSNFWIWSLPDGIVVDPAKNFGDTMARVDGVGNLLVHSLSNGNAKVTVFAVAAGFSAVPGTDCPMNPVSPYTLSVDDVISLSAAFPVTGWTARQ